MTLLRKRGPGHRTDEELAAVIRLGLLLPSASQRAIVAATIKQEYEKPREPGITFNYMLGLLLKVSETSVTDALAVTRRGVPELQNTVMEGRLTVRVVAQIARHTAPAQQQEELNRTLELRPYGPRQRMASHQVTAVKPPTKCPELQAALEELTISVSRGIGRVEAEIQRVDKIGTFRYIVDGSIAALHKSAEQLDMVMNVKFGNRRVHK